MEISIRSYLTAGVTAVVGATAIGLAPALPTPDLRAAALPAPVVAEIALTGTSIPWETIIAVVKTLSSGGSLQAGLTSLISSIGTEFAKEALPVVSALAGDVVKYVGTALADLFTGPDAPQIDVQALLATATAALTSGNIPGAIKALTSGLSVPLNEISKVLFTPEFQTFIMTKAGTVLGALPEILRSAVQKVVGIDIKPLIDMLSGLISKIIPGVVPPAASLTAPRALAVAAVPATVVASAATVPSAAAAEAPSAPETAPASPAEDSAKAPEESAPAAKAPESVPAADAAPDATPVSEVAPETTAVTEVTTPAETAAPVAVPSSEAPKASDSSESAPAPVARAAKPGPRHSAKSADSGSAAGRG